MEPEIQARIERLYENESLTDNLTDTDAKALLQWAEAQLRGNTNESVVTAAVSFANSSGGADTSALLAQAQAFLTKELHAQEITAARPTAASDASPEQSPVRAPEPEPQLGVSDASGTSAGADSHLRADAGAATSQPLKHKRRAKRRKS